MRFSIICLVVVAVVTALPLAGQAEERNFGDFSFKAAWKGAGGARGVHVEQKVRNDNPAFVVRVDVDHPDRIYKDRDLLRVHVVSEKAGYLYLFNQRCDGEVVCLFPNKFQSDNQIAARRKTTVPADNADFNLRVGKPFGEELILALVSLKPLEAEAFATRALTKGVVTRVDIEVLLKAVDVELKPKPKEWAEHHVMITTAPDKTPPAASRRVGLFIGISKYRDRRIPDLHVCHKDALVVAKVMEDRGDLDAGGVLTDENATLQNIRKAFKELAEKTNPGDEVFIFWSGHGARCADDNGDEEDGFDELLVPYDASVGGLSQIRESMLLDDTFGRWVQDLDGRKVVVILDACHAAGASAQTKGLGFAWAGADFDFWAPERSRTKDIGQKLTALLCSSQSHQPSKERKDGKLSVMTYYLLERILDKDVEQVSLDDAFDYLKDRVVRYVRENWRSERDPQTPVLINDIGEVYLRR